MATLPTVPWQQAETDNVHVPVNVLLDQKHSMSSQASPIPQANPGLCVCFLVLHSSSYKSILPRTPFCTAPNGDGLLQEVLDKVCVTYMVFFNHF